MRLCQEIKCFWRILSCLNIIVTRWTFGTRNEILSFAFLLFLWDNASQKLRIPSDYAKCKPLIHTPQIPPIMSRNTQKVIPSFQHHISHWMRSYSDVNAIWGFSYCFRVFEVLGQFGETESSAIIFLKLLNFIILSNGALNFLSRMGSINSFSQAVQEIQSNLS